MFIPSRIILLAHLFAASLGLGGQTIGFASKYPCTALNTHLTGGPSIGHEAEVYVDAHFLDELTVTSDGTIKPLLLGADTQTLAAAKLILKLPEARNVFDIKWADIKAEQKLEILDLAIDSHPTTDDNKGIPGLALRTELEFDLKKSTRIFGRTLSPGKQTLDLSPFLSNRILKADPSSPKLRHAEVHVRIPEGINESAESMLVIEELLRLKVAARHKHIIEKYPQRDKKPNKDQKQESDMILMEIIRVASIATEMIAVVREGDNLNLHLRREEPNPENTQENASSTSQYSGFYDYAKLDLFARVLSGKQKVDETVIDELKQGTISYRPPGKYQNKDLHGLEIRLVLDKTKKSKKMESELHGAFKQWGTKNPKNNFYQKIEKSVQLWLKANPDIDLAILPETYLEQAAIFGNFSIIHDPTMSKEERLKLFYSIKKSLTGQSEAPTSQVQLFWFLHHWPIDPLIANDANFDQTRYYQARDAARKALDEAEEPNSVLKRFVLESGIGDAFLAPFGMKL